MATAHVSSSVSGTGCRMDAGTASRALAGVPTSCRSHVGLTSHPLSLGPPLGRTENTTSLKANICG